MILSRTFSVFQKYSYIWNFEILISIFPNLVSIFRISISKSKIEIGIRNLVPRVGLSKDSLTTLV